MRQNRRKCFSRAEHRGFQSMNRRQFVTSSAITTLGATLTPDIATAAVAKPALMKLGCQTAPTNDTHLKYLARYGVRNICGNPGGGEGGGDDPNWATVDELSRMRDLAAMNGIEVDCVGPPLLRSSYIENEKHPAIMLAHS